jgi:threonylcarbamoyladenosine tRNA methylthiotransferase MtaB
MKAGFYTLGCKLNQCETEALAEAFRGAGFEASGLDGDACLYILNTCTVTSKSEQKARRVVRGVLSVSSAAPVILMGCYAEMGRGALEAEFGGRVFVAGSGDKAGLLELPVFLARRGASGPEACREAVGDFFALRAGGAGEALPAKGGGAAAFRFQAGRLSFHTRAFLKIQDGCDNRCAYCRVPLARGASVSLPPGEAVRRFRALQAEGYGEVVLTGVNLMSYRWENEDFTGLIERLLAEAGPGVLLRISSLEPEGIDGRLVSVLRDGRICPHFHLPVQSGSDRVLGDMGRGYTRRTVIEAVGRLREAVLDPFVAGDIICGFPGETDGDFGETLALVRELKLAGLHVFPFSPRPGTAAWGMKSRVPERVTRERAARLRALAGDFFADYAARQKGRELDVIVEKVLPGGGWEGLSANYMTVRGGEGPPPALPGRRLRVRIEKAERDFLWGGVV